MRDVVELYEIVAGELEAARTYSTIWEWADDRRFVAGNASARPGPWRTEDVPYWREPMEALSFTHPCERVVVVKGNQLGATEGLVMNLIGCAIDCWPGPILLITPLEEDVVEYSKTRIQPALAATPSVWARIGNSSGESDGAARDTFFTFPDGQLFLQGSKAPIREKPISIAIVDDADACQRNPEGDVVELAAKRTVTYERRKVLVISTPTIQGASVIDREYLGSSRKRYHGPCPLCGHYAPLEWEQVVFPPADEIPAHDPGEGVRYRCGACAGEWSEGRKLDALRHGIWIAECPELVGKREGYHVSALYSPFRRWYEIVRDFRIARRVMAESGDTSKMQVFYNCDLGKSWVLPEQVRLQGVELDVYKRREPPFERRALPQIQIVTAGIDVQADRLEASLWGWAPGMECWLLGHQVIRGSPENNAPFDELAAWLITAAVRGAVLDTGAFTQSVQDQIERIVPLLLKAGVFLWGVKGTTGAGAVWPKRLMPGETASVHVDAVKDQLFGALERVATPGPAYIHFSTDVTQSYLNQVFSERPRTLKDTTKARYVPIDGRRRNEALDCAVYARAAVYALAALEPRIAWTIIHAAGTAVAARPPAKPKAGGGRRRSWMSR